MKEIKLSYFLSIALRGTTLFSKFIFIILLAHFISPKDVGLFGLISGAVGYAIFAIGFEFYTYTTREMIKADKKELSGIMKNQLYFYIFSYLFFSPLIIAIYYYNILPGNTAYWFIALLFFEHTSQEVNRILITLQKQSFASLILFIRQGLWCWVAVFLMMLSHTYRTIETVFILWLLGTITASIIGVANIWKITRSSKVAILDWAWIKKGFYISTPMLVASLALRGMFTFDRFGVEHVSGLEVLGAYTLFISMTSAIQSFLDTILISFAFPKIAELASNKKYPSYFMEVKKFALQVSCLTFILCIGCWICGYFLMIWLHKEEYIALYPIFSLLIIATFIYCISLIPHLALYTLRKDRHIVISQIVTLGMFSVFLSLAVYYHNLYIIPSGMIVCFLFLCIWKTIAFINVAKKIKFEGSV